MIYAPIPNVLRPSTGETDNVNHPPHYTQHPSGVECIDIETVEIGLFMTLPPITEIKLDEEFDFPDELLFVLKKQVLEMGRFALMVPQERVNDGDDDTNAAQVPTNKLTSVNDPINRSDE